MGGVEGVAEDLEGFAVVAAVATIQPDGNKGQEGETLAGKEKRMAEEGKFIAEATQHFRIQIPQKEGLSHKMPPTAPPEKVEYQNG